MKLKTIEELSDKLDEEISWRRLELTNLKFNLEKAEGILLNINLRANLVLLYAHWEGFVKKALTYYLIHVSQQKLYNNELRHNFYAMQEYSKLKMFSQTKKGSIHTKIIDDIFESYGKISNIPYKNQIDTKSNLSSELFKELMLKVGLDYSSYESNFSLIDIRLLKNRNEIAHGENMNELELTKESYLELHREIMGIMDKLAEQIITAAKNIEYKSKYVRREPMINGETVVT